MAHKKITCTLDVETTRPLGKGQKENFPRVYDLGYLIHDNQGNILQQRSFIILEGFERFLVEGFTEYVAYYAKKVQTYYMPEMLKYYMGLTTQKWQPVSMKEAHETFLDDLKKYNVSVIQAYNAGFDTRELNTAWQFLGNKDTFIPADFEINDVWSMAVSVLACTPKYLKFCETYNFWTENKNPKSSAEAIFAFISQNPTFEEKHTGLEDCYIEMQIFLACLKKHKKMTKEIYYHPWRTLIEYANKRKGLSSK
jgi:hypothetical protein